MKRCTLVALVCIMVVITYISSVSADMASFRNEVMQFRNGSLSSTQLLESCDKALAGDVGDNADYERMVYSAMWEAYMMENKADEALKVADRALMKFPASTQGYLLKSDTYAMLLDSQRANETLKDGIAALSEISDKQALQERMDSIPYRINDFYAVWVDYDADHDAADKLYKEKTVEGWGVVTDIGKTGSGQELVLSFQTKKGANIGYQAMFSADNKDANAAKAGDVIAFSGRCRGKTFDVLRFSDCVIMQR